MINDEEGFRVGNKLTLHGKSDLPICGRGDYGIIYLGIFETTKPVAVKELQYFSDDEDHMSRLEPTLLLKLSGHPNILQYYCVEKDDEKHPQFVYIVTELCAGTLEHMIRETYKGPKVGDAREVLLQVTNALAYLHENGIAHGDIKPNNIFITRSYGTEVKPRMKLADFGCSSFILRKKPNSFPPNPASRKEVIDRYDDDEQNDKKDEYATDIFALGRVFFYFLSGGIDYDYGDGSNSVGDQLNKEKEKKRTDFNEKLAVELLESMLKSEPDKRPKVKEVLAKSFFNCHQQNRVTVSGQGMDDAPSTGSAMDHNKRKRKNKNKNEGKKRKRQNHITPNPAPGASGVDKQQNCDEESLRNKNTGLSDAFLEILFHFIPSDKRKNLTSSRDILEELQKICNVAHDS